MTSTADLSGDFVGRPGVALVTGGTGGLGAAICRLLAARGAAVLFTYRSAAESAERLAHELGPPAAARRLELTDATAVRSAIAEIVEHHGGLHTLVHAAGPQIPMVHLSAVTPEQYAEHLRDEALAFFTVATACLPSLRESHGAVVAVTTAATARFPVRDGLSAGTKGAVEAVARGLAAEEGRYGIRVNCVGPGMLTDGMADRLISSGELDERALAVTRANIPLRRFGSATDIAEAVCFLAGPRAGFISGQKLDVDGGYSV